MKKNYCSSMLEQPAAPTARISAVSCFLRFVWLTIVATVALVGTAQDFSDDFTRATNSASVLPWLIQTGNWSITNGVFLGGPNGSDTYGFSYITNNLTNCIVTSKFSAATTAFGYGLGARVNPANGAHYAAWLYPEGSPFQPSRLKLIKFPDWGVSSVSELAVVNIGPLGTNTHTLTMVLDTNFLSVYLDGVSQITYMDNSSPLISGGVSLDMYTYGPSIYTLTVDDVSAAPINYPPTATNDLFTLPGDLVQTVSAPGVLYNDRDPDDTNLTAVLVSTTANGTLNLSSNGGFTYVRTNSAADYDTFTYRATDGSATSGVATVVLSLTSGGVFFSDGFARSTNSASLVPWTAHSGNWAITNGIMEGGTNNHPSYGSIFHGGNWTNYAVQGSFMFPSNGYGGGIAGRVNPATGFRYAAWLYPENSDRGPNNIRIVKFQTWDAYGYVSFSNAQAIATIHLNAAVITNTWHTLKLAFQDNLLSAYYDGLWLTNVGDFDIYTNAYPSGGVSLDFFSYTNEYLFHAEDVVVRPLVADDNYVTFEDAQLSVTNGGLLANDTGITGAGVTAVLISGPANGSLTLNTNGNFDYTPATNFFGADSFIYEARDGVKSLGAAIVKITVSPQNDAPQFPNQPDFMVVAGATLSITNTAVDQDVPANNLSYALVGAPNGVSVSTNGVITWTPTLAQSPSTNLITAIVTDDGSPALTDTNLITIIVTAQPGTYTQTSFYENFDSVTIPALPVGWTTAQTGAQQVWFTQTSTRDSLPNAPLSPEPAAVGVNELVSPAIVLPAGEFQLAFRNNYDMEADIFTPGLAFDGGVLEIKIGGGSFTDILTAGGTFLTGGYNHTISTNFGNPLAGRSVWSGNTGGFVTTLVALPSNASGQTIRFRWRCGTDNATSGNGWVIDSVGLTNIQCCNLSAPVLAAHTNVSAPELVALAITNTASDSDLPNDQLSYTLLTGPVGAVISTNGVITWTPSEAQGPSTNIITTVVTDKAGLKATNSFTLTVLEVNSAPVLSVQTNRTIAELTLLSVTNSATDSDVPAQVLTYTLVTPPVGASITTNGVITWTPSEVQGPSTNTLTTVVSDGVASVTNSFVVVVTEVNSAPSFVAVPSDVSLAELTLLSVTNSATDSDVPAQVLTYTLVTPPVGASITTNGVITWTPSEAQGPSTNTLTTVVSDGVASATNSFVVVVTEVNSAPVLPGQTNVIIAEQTLLTVTNTASDSDLPANSLTYSLLVAPTNAVINTSGVITWTPSEAQGPSTNTLTTVVSDGVASATNSFVVVVTEVNSAPSFVAVPSDVSLAELTLLSVTNSATDSDVPAQVLTYTLVTPPVGASITTNGVITWTPSEVQGPSTNTLTTVVSDGVASVTNSFVVVVTEVNSAPSFVAVPSDVSLAELTLLSVTNSATDSDVPAQVLTYTLVTPPVGASITTNGVITWTPSEVQGPSTNTLTTVVSDGVASVTNSFVVVVTEVNSAPSFVAVPSDVSLAELTLLSVTNSATDSDVPAQVLTYTLVTPPVGASITTNGVITWTPSEAQGPSTNTLTTVVSDGVASATNSFVVVVTEVNSAPVLPGQTNVIIAEQTLLTVTNTASDSDLPANSLTYSLLVAPTNAVINTSGVITWTPSEAQGPSTNTLTTVVSDGVASATNSFVVVVTEVNSAPVLPGQTNVIIAEQTLLTVTNTASDSDLPANSLTYSLLVAPTNAVINTSGVITWTPSEAQGPSTNTLTTVVSDGVASATNSFVVVVTEVNSAPSFVAVPSDVSLAELTLLSVTNSATDSDVPAQVLTYTLVTPPVGASITTNGVITWTPSEVQGPSTNTLTTVVSDGVASVTNSFVVVVTEVNSAPSFVAVPSDVSLAELTLLSVTNSATDSDVPAQVLTYTLVTPPVGASITTNGVITWTPSEAQGPSTNTLTTVVSDGVASATNSFVVVVTEVNSAPVLPGQTNVIIAEQTLLTVTNTASDSDLPANSLTYSLLVAPTNAVINTSGVITWTPSEAQGPSTNTLTTVVSDGVASATNSFVVVVTEVNSAPSFVAVPSDVSLAELTLLSVTNSATDSDVPAQVLTYTLVTPPVGASITTNGVITWTPSEVQGPSTNTLTTVVSDGVASVTNSFVVVVTEVNSAPSFVAVPSDVSLAELTLLSVTNSATDSDVPAQVLTYTLVTPPVGASITTNGVITWTPSEAQGPSTNTLTTVVSDGVASATNSFVVVVTEVNSAPVLPGQTNVIIAEQTLLTVTNTASDSDLPANSLTYSLLVAPTNAVINTSGVITWTPSEAQGPSTNTLTTVVSDGVASATNSFVVVVTEVNSAPVLPGQTNVIIAEQTLLTVTNTASDSDLPANSLTYSLLVAPTNAVINTSGVITWTPSEAQGPSTNTLTTVVSDGVASATNSFVVVVTEVNSAPSFVAVPSDVSLAELTLLSVTNSATDSDVPAQVLTYTLVTPPVGASITTNGVITWTPSEAQGPSTNTLTTVVSDGVASATNSFVVVVTEVNLAPVATNDSYFLTNAVLTVAAPGILGNDSDADLPANTLTTVLVSGTTNGVLNLSSNGGFTYTPNIGFSGVDVFTYRANDGLTNSAVATVSITVSNRPFVITSVAVNSGLATVTWNSTPGLSYRVQYLNNLNSTNWTDVNPVVTATNTSASVTNFVGSNPQRFYRVKIVETPLPVILSLQVTNGNAVITWSSVAAKDYRLQYKTNLADLTWTEVTPSVTATAVTTTTTNAVGLASQRFFRIRLMP